MFCNEEEVCREETQQAPADVATQPEETPAPYVRAAVLPQPPAVEKLVDNVEPEWNQPAQPKMRWFKFLTNFLLFASTVLSLYQAIMYLTGGYYEGGAWEVFQYAPNLQVLDLYMSIFCACLAGLALYTRFRLVGYYANGPKLLTIMYIASVVANFVYLFAADIIVEASVLGSYVDLMEDLGSICGRSAISLGWMVFNMIYFKKHAEYFKN